MLILVLKKIRLSSDELYLSHTQLYRDHNQQHNQQWNVFSAFKPSKCTHTWSSGQPTLLRPGSSWGFGALLKGLTSVVDNSSRSQDSNTHNFGLQVQCSLSTRPRLSFSVLFCFSVRVWIRWWIGTGRWCLQPWSSAEAGAHPQWRPRLKML